MQQPRVPVNGIEIAYEERGSGPPMLFVHGVGLNTKMWAPQLTEFERDHRAIAVSLRGHGESSLRPGPYTLEQHASDLAAFVRALRLGPIIYVGLSLGGMVGQLFTARNPDLVRALVLADTTSDYGESGRARFDARVEQVRAAASLAPTVAASMERWFSKSFRRTHPEIIAAFAADLHKTDPDAYAENCHALTRFPLTEYLPRITCPTLVMVGEIDQGTTVAMAEVIQRGIAGSRLVILPGAAHLSNVERAAEFNAAIRVLLDQL